MQQRVFGIIAWYEDQNDHDSLRSDPIFDDPTHGMQQLTFFHGCYDQYQYQVRVITCAENDMTVLPVLLYGSAAVSIGAYDDVVRVINKIRSRFPDTIIEFRADAGFAVPRMYEALEAIPNVIYTIGFLMTSVLRKKSDDLLKSTENLYETTRTLAKQYLFFQHCAQSWKKRSRNIVIKCEANSEGSNRRAVITNRPGMANLFRLMMHTIATNMLVCF